MHRLLARCFSFIWGKIQRMGEVALSVRAASAPRAAPQPGHSPSAFILHERLKGGHKLLTIDLALPEDRSLHPRSPGPLRQQTYSRWHSSPSRLALLCSTIPPLQEAGDAARQGPEASTTSPRWGWVPETCYVPFHLLQLQDQTGMVRYIE